MRLLLYAAGIVITCGIIILLFLSYITPLSPISYTDKTMPLSKNARLYFNPKTILSPCLNTKHSSDIFLDSNDTLITETQIELQYNPLIISNVLITPSANNFFGEQDEFTTQLSEVRQEYGRVSLAIEASSSATGKKGNKPVATITFTASGNASATAQIEFLNKSTARTDKTRASILSTTTPLTISCGM